MVNLADVQATLDRLRAERTQAAATAERARVAVGDMQRQLTELRKREDLAGVDLTQTIITATALSDEAQRQMVNALAQMKELGDRITALERELPALQRAERKQRLDALIGDLRQMKTAYTGAAKEFLQLHALYSQGYMEASRLASVDADSPSVGASPIGEMEMVESMRRAVVLQSATLPERLTK